MTTAQVWAAALVGAALLLQGSSLGDGERAQADPLPQRAPLELRGTAQPDQALDGVRYVRTTAVPASENLLAPPADILRCEQPASGLLDPRSASQSGCVYEKVAGLSPQSAPGSPASESVASATPDSFAATALSPASPGRDGVPEAGAPALQLAARPVAPALIVEEPRAMVARPASADQSKPQPDVRLLGRWYPNAKECSVRGAKSECLPLVIGERSAKAGPASCRFLRKQQEGQRLNVVARCTNASETWTANIRLVVTGKRLTWTSERGSQDYVR